MKVEIEKNVPVPEWHGRSGAKYPWDTMEVGESFIAQCKNINSLSTARNNAERRYNRKFSCRTTPEGVRVWRVA